jgi:hypothetical protein
MNIDLSKITQTELDKIIKEEALKIKAEMLRESKMTPKQKKLVLEKRRLESELAKLNESPDLEEGIFGKLFGGNGGNNDKARSQMVLNLLKHPVKSTVLLTYASPEQLEQFKSYMPEDKKSWIDWSVRKLGAKKMNDPARTESYIKFFMDGGKNPTWDAQTHQYSDVGKMTGNVSTAFAEGDQPQA